MAKSHDYGMSRGSKPQNKGGNRTGGNGNKMANNNHKIPSTPATAPYNFIQLPPKPVLSPLGAVINDSKEEKAEAYKQYIAENGKLSGYIDYELEALTPVYIGEKGKFFAPNGEPILPGSSMRGMIKNYLKIISCGTMRAENNEDLTSRHLYFRGLASKCKPFRDYYSSRMTKKINAGGKIIDVSKAEAGFLIRDNQGKWFVVPGVGRAIKDERTVSRVVTCIEWGNNCADCYTGKMNGKKHYYNISSPDYARKIPVAESIIQDYREDKTRKGLNLLESKWSNKGFIKGVNNIEFLVPCYYVVDARGENVLSFGHGRYYRIPYLKSIESHIPHDLRDADAVDFADAIFGRKEDWASRVAFEDAVIGGAVKLRASKSHNLMGPNPTSFQLYLRQSMGGNSKHWDDDINIRGYKLYWHNNITENGWRFKDKNNGGKDMDVKGTIPIEPLAKGATFGGRIRFNRLSKEELGALLAVFALCDNTHCFKIGMGKPLGMGSMKLNGYDLHLFDMQQRYGSLFGDGGWQEGCQEEQAEKYRSCFGEYMNKAVQKNGTAKDYADIIQTLRQMMDWSNTSLPKWNKELEYMPIGDKNDKRYADRVPLETPGVILARLGKK